MFGAVDPFSGEICLNRVYGRITSSLCADFLYNLSKRFSEDELIMMEDNAPWHSKKLVIKILKDKGVDNIHIIRFPKYSPNMNPCEKLWNWMRETVSHCRYYKDLNELLDSIWRTYRRIWNNKELGKIRFKTEISIFDKAA
jgi:transposase